MAMLIAWHTVNAARQPGSRTFSNKFLIVAPGITIKDRLRVLLPNDTESYFRHRDIVPADMLRDIDHAKIVITNYHAFKLRERVDIAKGTRQAIEGWRHEEMQTLETKGQMIRRVMPELMGQGKIVVLNDEAHHCYRERVEATFTADSVLNLTPDLVGPSQVRNQGILGEGVELNLAHLKEMRASTILYHLTTHLLFHKYRDPGEEPKLHLFHKLKRVAREWLDGGYLKCSGGTYPGQLMYRELADKAAERIKMAITLSQSDERPVKAILDAYNPTGSTSYVNFTTSKELRWQTDARKCHVNWVVCDSDWEAEFCRVVESHPRVRAYVKNHNLGLEVPYLWGSIPRRYIPDFIVQVDDGRPDPLNLIVEIKGYRGEDAKEKANTISTYWVPGVNNLARFGRWAFVEFREVFEIDAEFRKLIDALPMAEVAA
jgi:hypothetical protein